MEGRGFGFVTFAEAASARSFLSQREHSIDGKRVEVKSAVPKGDMSSGGGGGGGGGMRPTTKIFIGGTVRIIVALSCAGRIITHPQHRLSPTRSGIHFAGRNR